MLEVAHDTNSVLQENEKEADYLESIGNDACRCRVCWLCRMWGW